MTEFRRRPIPVLVWRYNRQPQTTWPAWVRDYRVSTSMGVEQIGISGVGSLLVPTRGGTHTGNRGDSLVLENYQIGEDGAISGGRLQLVRAQEFDLLFEQAPEEAPAAAEA
jgi:hypothetical protein